MNQNFFDANSSSQSHLYNDTISNTTALNGTVSDPPSLSVTGPQLFALSLVIVLTLVGNGLVVIVFFRNRELHTYFNVLLGNLAIADFLVGAIVLPCFGVYIYYGYWPYGEPFCSIYMLFDWLLTFESVATLAMISLERIWSVYRWTEKGRSTVFNGWTVTVIITCTWLFAVAIWVPGFITDRIREGNSPEECNWDVQENWTAAVIMEILGYLIPYLILLISCLFIGVKVTTYNNQAVRRTRPAPESVGTVALSSMHKTGAPAVSVVESSSHHRATNEPNSTHRSSRIRSRASRTRQHKAVLLTMVMVALAFSVSWVPLYVYYFATLFHGTVFPDWYSNMCYWLPYLNSAVNPLLYSVFHKDFRPKINSLFQRTLS